MKSNSVINYHVSNVIGCYLRGKRKEMGFSSAEVAQCVGISQQHLSRYENGKSAINVEILFSLLVFFNIRFSDFYINILSLSLEHRVLSRYISHSDTVGFKLKSCY